MKIRLTRALALSLAVLTVLLSAVSCGKTEKPAHDTDPVVSSGAPVVEETTDANAFTPLDLDLGGEEFVIYNCEDKYNMIMNVLADDVTGESVQDAKYTARLKVEEEYKVKLVEHRETYENIRTPIQTACQSNDHIYDSAFLRSTDIGAFMTSGYMRNMFDVTTADISKPWYDQRIKENSTIKNKYLFYLLSDANLMALEGTWAIFFNKSIAEEINMEDPYALVRSGKWTFDKLRELAASGASLNGDTSWDFIASGSSVYGMASFKNFINAAVTGCGEFYTLKDSEDVPYYAFSSSATVYDVADKIVSLTGATADGTYISANSSGKHYLTDIFSQNRALFCGAELKAAANELNNMDKEFGLLPIPKFTEDQESYYSNILWSSLMYTLPSCVEDPQTSAAVMDAISFYNYDLVIPKYSERVTYRGLKDSDSVEMCNLIHDTRYFVWGLTYGWLSSIEPNINTQLDAGNSKISGLVKSSAKAVPMLINDTLEALKD